MTDRDTPRTKFDADAIVAELGPILAEHAAAHDHEGTFVEDNYAHLRRRGLFSAMVPTELGGGGAGHAELCDVLRRLAHHCGSTALALSMHSHLVAATVWKVRRGQPGEALLRKVADGERVLISTGAGDWLQSTGTMQRVDGGFRVTATKAFCSGSPVGDIFITSARYDDPNTGPRVLHFPVAAKAEGVTIGRDWDTVAMRGSGSHTCRFEDVFVPQETIALDRPREGWHPAWNVVLTVAAPIYTAPYVGIAEAACGIARNAARSRQADPSVPYLLGEMENQLVTAQMALREMIGVTNDFDFDPVNENANAVLIRKTIATKAAIAAVDKAMEAVGGGSLFRSRGLESRFRDVRAGTFHPLPEKPQTLFTGRMSLGLDPIAVG